MGSLAVSRLAADEDLSASIADQVATIARKNLAPMAASIDAGTVYPDELLRRLGGPTGGDRESRRLRGLQLRVLLSCYENPA